VKNGSDSDLTPPDELIRVSEGILPGEGDGVEAAIKDAWGKRKKGDSRVYRVHEVYVWGESPISGYRVILGPTS
jgi:hypothetical protein